MSALRLPFWFGAHPDPPPDCVPIEAPGDAVSRFCADDGHRGLNSDHARDRLTHSGLVYISDSMMQMAYCLLGSKWTDRGEQQSD